MKFLMIILLFSAFIPGSCSKRTSEVDPPEVLNLNFTPSDFVGKWTLYETLGNDHWGGYLHWSKGNPNTKIEFTPDNKYYRKEAAEAVYKLIGTYVVLPGGKIEITLDNPVNPAARPYAHSYTFEPGGLMEWNTGFTEGVVIEKFKFVQ
jgi:hypothetical protein